MAHQPKQPIPCTTCGAPKAWARKLCKKCYYREYAKGTHKNFEKLRPRDIIETNVDKSSGCWVWLGTRNEFGYGIVITGNKSLRAHRVSYEAFKGDVPPDKVVMHSCDNPSCVNPEHLSVGSKTDNNRDAVRKNRHAHGEKNGHAKLTAEQVKMIKESAYEGTQASLAKKLGVHQSVISKIKSGNRWKHV